MAVYAIGDLQGCYDSYCRLLDKLGFDPSRDRIWLTGDLVNRGSKSLKTLRHVYRNRDSMLTVLGNHDLLLLKMAYSKNARRGPADLKKILDAPEAQELIDWLRTRPLFHYDESLDTALVHAGVVPEWTLRQAQKRSQEVEAVLASERCHKFLKR
ncbi:MAG: symmetrical bis(5'-nucleosyl)-tetraphosphatase, partial [Pseudomonadota bacterium]